MLDTQSSQRNAQHINISTVSLCLPFPPVLTCILPSCVRTRSRSIVSDRSRPFLSDRSCNITHVYSLVIDHAP